MSTHLEWVRGFVVKLPKRVIAEGVILLLSHGYDTLCWHCVCH